MASDLDSSLANGGIRVAGSELTALYTDRAWSGTTAKGSAFAQKLAADGTGVSRSSSFLMEPTLPSRLTDPPIPLSR
jgi:hypothetical protein